MWYYPASFCIGIRDVIGAWLVSLAIATGFCAWAMSADRETNDEGPGIGVSATLETRHETNFSGPLNLQVAGS